MRKSFAFLIHPRNTLSADMGDLFGRPFGWLSDSAWARLLATLPTPPLVTGRIRYHDAPTVVAGHLVTVPLTPTQLLTLPRRKVRHRIEQAVDKARDLGASVVGLGALTAPATTGGKALVGRGDIGVTNGNAFTAAMTLMGIERLMNRIGGDPVVALVGATGSVGACLTRLFASQHTGRLLLVARNTGRLDALADEVRRPGLTVETATSMEAVCRADLVVLLTSAADAILGSEHLKEGAVVLDDTVPRNTSPSLSSERPDVLILDGGLVRIPGVEIKGAIGLPKGLAYACLAETMLLALDGHEGHFSIGSPTLEQARHMLALARRHADIGFDLAPFRSFGRPVDEAAVSGQAELEAVACPA